MSQEKLYGDLSWLWPLWGSVGGDYARWCGLVVRLMSTWSRRPVTTLLSIGCGGGKNIYNLKKTFEVTGMDLSEAMLEQARKLNPECTFVQGDMRSARLGRLYDAVFIEDAVSYMTCREDLRAAFVTAWEHLAEGGVLVVSPDETKESFRQNDTRVTHANPKTKPSDVDVVFVENYYDADPDDETYEGTLVYLIRKDGKLQVETDLHLLGLFPLEAWRMALRDVGFEIHEECYDEGNRKGVSFVCIKREV